MAEEEEDIRIKDRRRFSPETGEAYDKPPAHDKTSSLDEGRAAEQKKGTEKSSESLSEVTFTSFILGLSTQALMCLGEIPSPQDGRPHQDLPAARQMIDILGMLKKKTESNLEKSEEQLIDQILFDLRMKYVEISKRR